jgi:hypothetical protein
MSNSFPGSRVACSRSLRLIALSLLLLLAFAFAASGEESLLSYSLSSAPSLASSLWQGSKKLSTEKPLAIRGSYEAPVWAQEGARNLELSLASATRLSETIRRYEIPAFRNLRGGIGDYFPNDTTGKARFCGTGVEDLRWIYLKIKVLGGRSR